MMIYVGIDPGLDGALAVLCPTHDGIDPATPFARVWDTPTLVIEGKSGTKREYDEGRMSALLQGVLTIVKMNPIRIQCALESTHAMPGQGVRSMFSMGVGLGLWRGFLAGLGIPYSLVPPQRWKKVMLDGQGHDKDASRYVAMKLFPTVNDRLARKKDDGRAEALLLAEYYRRVTHGQ